MKKNTTKVGTKKEELIRDIFKNAGYDTDFKPKTSFYDKKTGKRSFFNVATDLFTLWDTIAIKEGKITFVQVKFSKDRQISNVSTFKKKVKDSGFMEKHGKKNTYLIILIFPNREFRVWRWKNEWVEETGLNI